MRRQTSRMNQSKTQKGLERMLIILILLCAAGALMFLIAALYRKGEIRQAQNYYQEIGSSESDDYFFTESQEDPGVQPAEDPLSQGAALLADAPQPTVAWIRSEGTPIDYPVGQATDNEYYLRHLLDGTYNRIGSIFMDWRNHPDLSDDNTILYGHHFDDTDIMFATLIHYMDQSYYEEHPQMELFTAQADYTVHLVAGFTADAYTELPLVFGENTADRQKFIDYILEHSDFTANIPIAEEDRFVTMVTCTNGGASRYLLFGVLEKKQ